MRSAVLKLLSQLSTTTLSQRALLKGSKNHHPASFKLFFLNTHLGYSLNFTVVCLCHMMGGIPPPSRGIVGKNRSMIPLTFCVIISSWSFSLVISPGFLCTPPIMSSIAWVISFKLLAIVQPNYLIAPKKGVQRVLKTSFGPVLLFCYSILKYGNW